jgi:long-subunit fatty acid transport protein
MGDVSFALGTNLANTLYIGASLNINVLDYRQTSFHYEEDAGDSIPEFKNFTFKEYFRTRGSGVSGKFGLIYRPVDFLRLGIAFHTPTSFSLTDRYANDMTAQYDGGATTEALSPNGVFKYRYSNPMRLQISGGFILSKFALLGVEYELIPYKGMRFRESTASVNTFQAVNDRIRDIYRTGHTIKLGGEFRLDPISLRAGFNYSTSPYRRDVNNSPVWGISAGAGYRDMGSGFFVDFAYSLFVIKEAYWLYDSNLVPAAMNRTGKNNFLLTAGFNF